MSYLVTGGIGCSGAWVVSNPRQRGERVVNFGFSDDRRRCGDWVGIGTALGVAMDNIAIVIPIGVAVGVAIGVALA